MSGMRVSVRFTVRVSVRVWLGFVFFNNVSDVSACHNFESVIFSFKRA